jgi:dihydropteroate synthase
MRNAPCHFNPSAHGCSEIRSWVCPTPLRTRRFYRVLGVLRIDIVTRAHKVPAQRMLLRACQFTFKFPRPALVMGVLNVTPDSFSDGGRFVGLEAALKQAEVLIAAGAEILDIGGESTRPNAAKVGAEEEKARVVPVIRELARTNRVPISIDTMKPAVARAAIEAGAVLVNDVGANRIDQEMWELVARTGVGYVVMHMLGTPQTMQENPRYGDVVGEVGAFFQDRLARLQECGVKTEQVILDPGIGFGKTLEHNLELLAGLGQFRTYQRPLLIGASRKAFVGQVTAVAQADRRLAGSLACACSAVAEGANVIRAHDVAETREAIRMMEAIQARRV